MSKEAKEVKKPTVEDFRAFGQNLKRTGSRAAGAERSAH